MGKKELVDIDIDGVKSETEKAWLVTIDGEDVWLPKSQCEMDTAGNVVTMPEWLAIEKELV